MPPSFRASGVIRRVGLAIDVVLVLRARHARLLADELLAFDEPFVEERRGAGRAVPTIAALGAGSLRGGWRLNSRSLG